MVNRDLTHLDSSGAARMVDVGDKPISQRIAIATGMVSMSRDALEALQSGNNRKGNVIATARIAAIMAAKRCSDLIPLCHPLALSKINVDFEIDEQNSLVRVTSRVGVLAQTGVEMEALCAVSVACLTIYDMLKAIDKAMEIGNIKLLEKSGGQSGNFSSLQ